MITITGASGQLGREVANALQQRISPSKVRLGTRNPGKISDVVARGFQAAEMDFDDPEGMVRAFDGSDVVFIICGDSSNEIRIPQHRRAIDAAKAAGVGRVVYTSFVNPCRESLFPFAKVHEDSENYLKQSGLNYTFLRNNHYAENLNKALELARSTGVLSLPGANEKVAYICRADIAAATAAVLVGEGHDKRSYELTGSEALNLSEVAAMAAEIWKSPIVAKDMDVATFRSLLVKRGLPEYLVEAQIGIWLAAGAGEYRQVTQDAMVLAGRPLRSFSDFLALQA